MVSAIIQAGPGDILWVRFNAAFTEGGSEQFHGTGGNTAMPDDWSDVLQVDADTIELTPDGAGIWIPGATAILTTADDIDWAPYTLTLPLSFTIGP